MAETIKGLNIKLGLDATELNEKLGKVKTDLKEQQADLKAINAKLKYDSSNVDAWKEKQSQTGDRESHFCRNERRDRRSQVSFPDR